MSENKCWVPGTPRHLNVLPELFINTLDTLPHCESAYPKVTMEEYVK